MMQGEGLAGSRTREDHNEAVLPPSSVGGVSVNTSCGVLQSAEDEENRPLFVRNKITLKLRRSDANVRAARQNGDRVPELNQLCKKATLPLPA
jgi:hypothetical protein